MRKFLRWLRAQWRFTRASKLQANGRFQEALSIYSDNRTVLGDLSMDDGANLSLRLMNLVQLAQVSMELGHRDMTISALEDWVAVWKSACQRHPKLASLESLAKWESWVHASLGSANKDGRAGTGVVP